MFGCTQDQVGRWIQLYRAEHGTLSIPPRTTNNLPPHQNKSAPPNLTVLPPPAPPKELDPELTTFARNAVRLRLQRLADPNVVADESSKDMCQIVKTLTDSYDILPGIEGKTPVKDRSANRLAEALMGKLPDDEEEEEPTINLQQKKRA